MCHVNSKLANYRQAITIIISMKADIVNCARTCFFSARLQLHTFTACIITQPQ